MSAPINTAPATATKMETDAASAAKKRKVDDKALGRTSDRDQRQRNEATQVLLPHLAVRPPEQSQGGGSQPASNVNLSAAASFQPNGTEQDGSDSSDEGAGSIALQIRAIAAELDIHSDTVLSFVLQREPAILQKSLVPLKVMLEDPKTIAMCGGTADDLSELLRAGKKKISENRPPKQRGKDAKLLAVATQLAEDVRSAASEGCVFRVHYGIHHFAVIARGNRGEIIQSFASGTEPRTVGYYLRAPRAMPLETLCGILTDLGSADAEKRSEAQASISEMAEDVAKDKAEAGEDEVHTYLEDSNMGQEFPNITLTFSGYPLQEDAVLVQTLRNRLTKGLHVLSARLQKEGVKLADFDEKAAESGTAYVRRMPVGARRLAEICAAKSRALTQLGV